MKLIVLDADGVLSKGEAHPFDLDLFDRLAELNRRSERGEPVPAVTLNTGRPSAYVEAVMQAIAGWQPALYESGAGLYLPQTYQFRTNPLLGMAQLATLGEIIKRVDATVVQSGRAYWQPGKTVCYTLFAHPPLTIADIGHEVETVVRTISDQFVVIPAVLALNIHPVGIDKGSGIEWLGRITGIELAEMGGVGDSAGDIDFLRLVGHPAAPHNATSEVRGTVNYISPYMDAAGLEDILNYWGIP